MPNSQGGIAFTLLSSEFFESLDRYEPAPHWRDWVATQAGSEWTVFPRGFWTQCQPRNVQFATEGWKIHLSAVLRTAEETLHRIAPLLIEEGVPFKFCSDPRMVALSTSKNWSRIGAGKFITAYPSSESQFVQVIERCHQATDGMRGPYILSDRPYKDSKVVFYRFGGHQPARLVGPDGAHRSLIQNPDGRWEADPRGAVFSLPRWVRDPFASSSPRPERGEVILKDRYKVTGAIKYASSGGLYWATDTETGTEVVLREMRPMLATQGTSDDAFNLLEKEARILQKLGPTGFAPQFVDLFQEWEHRFLVQERLEAEKLWFYAMQWLDAMRPAALPPPSELFDSILHIIQALARGIEVIHGHGVVLRDLTKTNVLITPDHRVKFIDFELAYEVDRDDPPCSGGTPGYMSPQQAADALPAPEDDHYALGALILDMLAFNVSGYDLNPEGTLATLSMTLRDHGLPAELRDVVEGLMSPDTETRWHPDRALSVLRGVRGLETQRLPLATSERPLPRPAPPKSLRREVSETIGGVVRYTLAKADYERRDRLWPASPGAFTTNPLGLRYGAAGTAYFLLSAVGEVPDRVIEWTLNGLNHHSCPPGLYSGTSGVAVLLLGAGHTERARELMNVSYQPDLIYEQPGLSYGAAGWGLANLHFWLHTAEDGYLGRALEVGEHLLQSATANSEGISWPTDGTVHFGLGLGQSGIALFLTYLNAASPDPAWLEAARRALDYEIAHVERRDSLLLWKFRKDGDGRATGSLVPYMEHGSAGVGSALVRFYASTGEDAFLQMAERCAHTAAYRHSNKLWLDYGLAGMGEFLLDMHRFTGDENYLNNAFYLAKPILLNAIPRPEGTAFPGLGLSRISCDLGMGSAGIGLFCHRLLNPKGGRLLFPDELLEAYTHGVGGKGAGSESAGSEDCVEEVVR